MSEEQQQKKGPAPDWTNGRGIAFWNRESDHGPYYSVKKSNGREAKPTYYTIPGQLGKHRITKADAEQLAQSKSVAKEGVREDGTSYTQHLIPDGVEKQKSGFYRIKLLFGYERKRNEDQKVFGYVINESKDKPGVLVKNSYKSGDHTITLNAAQCKRLFRGGELDVKVGQDEDQVELRLSPESVKTNTEGLQYVPVRTRVISKIAENREQTPADLKTDPIKDAMSNSHGSQPIQSDDPNAVDIFDNEPGVTDEPVEMVKPQRKKGMSV